jgi:methylated-DNA-protein-cysteine methyltransferase-like protein
MPDYTFYDNVYDVVRLIPKGRVTSYGAIAAYLGSKQSSRVVGYAMMACGTANPPVPAHRVVNRQGLLQVSSILVAIRWSRCWKMKV